MKKKAIVVIGASLLALILIVAGVLFSNTMKQSSKGDEKETEHIDIKTPYATLEFPKELAEDVKAEVSDKTETGAYTVAFYGTLEGKGKIHLSDLIFGGDDGYTVGYLTAEKGKESIAVNIVYHDAESDNWSDDEMIEIQEMQSGVEHAIDMLVESGKLELAK